MIETWYIWMAIFVLLLVTFLVCLKTARNRKIYIIYFISGMALGFYLDIVSLTNGYYSYPNIFPVTLLGLPVTMTIAEGFSVAITMRVLEIVKAFLARETKGRKRKKH